MSKTMCNVQNRISVNVLGFSFLNTTKKKFTPPLVGVYFDETLTNLINLTYSVYKPPFGLILVKISSLVLELLITHNKEGM